MIERGPLDPDGVTRVAGRRGRDPFLRDEPAAAARPRALLDHARAQSGVSSAPRWTLFPP